MTKTQRAAQDLSDNRNMKRRFAAIGMSVALGAATLAVPGIGTAHASTPYPTNYQTTNENRQCSPLSKEVTGVIRGYDGNAVNAYIGLDLNTTVGSKLVKIDGGGCSGSGAKLASYGITVHVNYQISSQGVAPANDPDAVTTWSAMIPANTTNIYFEVTPKGLSSQPKFGVTDQTYYGNSMRPNIAITKSPQTISTLSLPVNKCGTLSTGSLKGWIYKGGKRVSVSYVAAFSQGSRGSGTPAGNGPFGFNNVTYTSPASTYVIPKLASGGGKGQSYTIIAKLADGTSKQFYMLDAHGIQHGGVLACKADSFNLTF